MPLWIERSILWCWHEKLVVIAKNRSVSWEKDVDRIANIYAPAGCTNKLSLFVICLGSCCAVVCPWRWLFGLGNRLHTLPAVPRSSQPSTFSSDGKRSVGFWAEWYCIAMVGVDNSSLWVYTRPKLAGLVWVSAARGTVRHLSDEPGELCNDYSTITLSSVCTIWYMVDVCFQKVAGI